MPKKSSAPRGSVDGLFLCLLFVSAVETLVPARFLFGLFAPRVFDEMLGWFWSRCSAEVRAAEGTMVLVVRACIFYFF